MVYDHFRWTDPDTVVAHLADNVQHGDRVQAIDQGARLLTMALYALKQHDSLEDRKSDVREAFLSLADGSNEPTTALLRELQGEVISSDNGTRCEVALLTRHLASVTALSDKDAGIAEFRTALELDATDHDSWFGLARLHESNGDLVAAERAFNRVIHANQHRAGKRLMVEAYKNLERIYANTERETLVQDARRRAQSLSAELANEARPGGPYDTPAIRIELERVTGVLESLIDLPDGLEGKEGVAILRSARAIASLARNDVAGACLEWRTARALFSELDDPRRTVFATRNHAESCCPA